MENIRPFAQLDELMDVLNRKILSIYSSTSSVGWSDRVSFTIEYSSTQCPKILLDETTDEQKHDYCTEKFVLSIRPSALLDELMDHVLP